MARVTVEDCVERITNRFDLVMVAAQRSRDISSGAPMTIEKDGDKNPVIALREIADVTIDIEEVSESLIRDLQHHVEVDEPEDDDLDEAFPGETALLTRTPGLTKQEAASDFDDATAELMGMQVQDSAEAAEGFQDIDDTELAKED